jgi:hypothetical protein
MFKQVVNCEGAPCHPLRRSIVPKAPSQTFVGYTFQALTVQEITFVRYFSSK